MGKEVFMQYESEVRSYCRIFDQELATAKGAKITDVNGKEYIDFFCGAGALNYGHNNPYIKEKIIDYIEKDGIMHAMDMHTEAKEAFISYFQENILKPRNMDYKIMFPGPTGTNGVEAALKLARKVKKRSEIWCLMGCFHGMTLGTLSLTAERGARHGAGVPLTNVTHIPAPYMFDGLDTVKYMQTLFGVDYLKAVREFCDKNDILLIIDDVQVGCGRTGSFFSFERAGIQPDIFVLSKSVGGYGFPFALTLFRPELDIWSPGEHNGTFRGNQLAMVAARAALELFNDNHMEEETKRKSKIIEEFLNNEIKPLDDRFEVRGIGFIWGIDTHDSDLSKRVSVRAFSNGLIMERAGRRDEVDKVMPPLIIDDETLIKGLNILKKSFVEELGK